MIGKALVTKAFAGLIFSNDGAKTTILGKAGDYNRIGDAGVTSHSLASEDDLLITGKLEVDGAAFLDGALTVVGSVTVGPDISSSSSSFSMRAYPNITFLAFNDSAYVEVAAIVGAADPHFRANSQEDGVIQAFTYGGIAITNYKVVKVTKAHNSDLFDAAATTDSVTIWTQPVNSKLIAVMMRLETQFAGTSWTDLRVTIGLAGDTDGLVTTTGNLTSDAADTEYENAGAYYDAFTEGLHGKTNAAIAWIAYATATGGNLNASTAGTMDFYFIYEQP